MRRAAPPRSLRFDVRRDDDFLYLAFAVRDATPLFARDRTSQLQDGITVELDARPDPARSRTTASRLDRCGTITSLFLTTLAPWTRRPIRRLDVLLPAPPRRRPPRAARRPAATRPSSPCRAASSTAARAARGRGSG